MKKITGKMYWRALQDGWSDSEINAGYVVCDHGNGNLHIERIDVLGRFESDWEAAEYAQKNDHIKLLAEKDLLYPYLDTEKNRKDLPRLQDEFLRAKWAELADIPFDENGNDSDLTLAQSWWIFSKGTEREEIWRYFDIHYHYGVAALLYPKTIGGKKYEIRSKSD